MSYSPLWNSLIGKGSSRQTQTGYQNGSGSSMVQALPVCTNVSGQIVGIDVSTETSAEAFVGLTASAIPNAASGQVISDGRLENIPLGLGFAVGDPLWIGPTGTLTNVKPDLSVMGWSAGDFVIFIGVVVKNEFNPSNQDIQIMRQIIGRL